MIYSNAINSVLKGSSFSVNLEEKTLIVGKKKLIDNGVFNDELGIDVVSTEDALCEIERLYGIYKISVPNENSERRHSYFKALKVEELEDYEMITGEIREVAQIKLELYILCAVLNGSLVWDNEKMGSWFWKSKKFNDLAILKKWINN